MNDLNILDHFPQGRDLERTLKLLGKQAYDAGYLLGMLAALNTRHRHVLALLEKHDTTEEVRMALEYGEAVGDAAEEQVSA